MSEEILLRPAERRDAEALAAIHTDGWRTGYAGLLPQAYLDDLRDEDALPRWESQLTGRGSWTQVTVAELAGEVVGFVGYGACVDPDVPALPELDGTPRPGGWGEIWDLFVAGSARGRGVGGRLLEHGLDQLRSQGYREIVVWVLDANGPAERVYAKAGFERDGVARTQKLTDDFTMRDNRWRLFTARRPA